MKIIHYTYDLSFGGIETMLINIANEQVKYPNDVYIVVLNRFYAQSLIDKIDSRVKIIFIDKPLRSKNLLYILKLNYVIARINPDIIHFHYARLRRTLLLPGIKDKCCVTMHDICNGQNSDALHRFKYIYAISEYVRQDIKKRYNLDSIVVLNGIHPEEFKQKTKGTRPDLYKIVQVSRLMHEKKGQDILIKALQILKSEGVDNIQVDFIGEGPSLAYLKKLSDDLGVSNQICFLGAREQKYIQQHLCDYDLFVQPSLYEGFGLTVAEAMAAKVPVLVSDIQGPLEIIGKDRFGFSFKKGNAGDCASKIKKIMENEVSGEFIDEAYNRVCTLYNVQRTAFSYLEQYKKIQDNDNIG